MCAVGRYRISVAVMLTQIRVEVRTDRDFSFVSGYDKKPLGLDIKSDIIPCTYGKTSLASWPNIDSQRVSCLTNINH